MGPKPCGWAYNRFYQPELAQWEARNRTPDRSHNETWDSLAITGGLGFLANSLLFLSIFFWALRWLGLIRSRRDVALFFSSQLEADYSSASPSWHSVSAPLSWE